MDFHISDDDFSFEENVVNSPNDLKPWLSYIASVNRRYEEQKTLFETDPNNNKKPKKSTIYVLYERALNTLPGSYKLWYSYLTLLTTHLSNIPPTHPNYDQVNNIFERSLYTMHKMPVIWRIYIRFLIRQKKITKTRTTFDRALQSLPITQHEFWIWRPYMAWIEKDEVPTETGRRVFQRFLKLFPEKRRDYIDFLLKRGIYDEACLLLTKEIKEEKSVELQSQFWKLLCETISKHPLELSESGKFDVEKTLHEGWAEHGEIGSGWVTLAQYFAALGSFEKCRDIFEEALSSVKTVRDFTLVFDSYSKFEGSIVEALMMKAKAGGQSGGEEMRDEEKDVNEEEGESDSDEESDDEEDDDLFTSEEKIEFAMKRWELLMDRRPDLLNLVKLRRNPNDVLEWLNRVRLYLPREDLNPEEHSNMIVEIFTKALETIEPTQSTGRMVRLWIEFSKFYEEFHQDLGKARRVLDVGGDQGYLSVSDLTTLHAERAELEIRHQNIDGARKYLRTVLKESVPSDLRDFYKGGNWRMLSPQKRIFRSVPLWSFFVDLEVSMGDLESARGVYEEMIRLKVITISQLLEYGKLLESSRFYSAACRVYEKGILIFHSTEKKKNHVVHIWTKYLSLVIKRYRKEDLEHVRSLFERCIKQVVVVGSPEMKVEDEEEDEEVEEDGENVDMGGKKERNVFSYGKYFFLWYSWFEEKYGRIRNCLELFERSMEYVKKNERLEMYKLYVRSVSKYHPISKVREVYDSGLQNVGKEDLEELVLEYIQLEVKLAEIDRARSLFEHAAQFCGDTFFQEWEQFENRFGNLDTFKMMYKVREKYNKK